MLSMQQNSKPSRERQQCRVSCFFFFSFVCVKPMTRRPPSPVSCFIWSTCQEEAKRQRGLSGCGTHVRYLFGGLASLPDSFGHFIILPNLAHLHLVFSLVLADRFSQFVCVYVWEFIVGLCIGRGGPTVRVLKGIALNVLHYF